MKILLPVFLVLFFYSSLSAQSNVKAGCQGVYYNYSDGAFFGPAVAFEAHLKNRLSLQINAGYLRGSEVIGLDQNVVTRGFRFAPEIRYFPKGDMSGFFIGARVSYTDFSSVLKTGGEKLAFPTWGDREGVGGLGGVLGFQTNFSERFKIATVMGIEMDMGEGELGILSVGISLGYNL